MDEYHDDAAQDLAQIRPIFEMLIGRIEALENLTERIVMGFSGAVNTQKRRSLLGGLREKHGETLGGIAGIYGDLVGGDPFEALADEAMKLRDADDYSADTEEAKINELIDTLMKKFGKYIPKPQEAEVETTTIEVEPKKEKSQKSFSFDGPRI